MGAAAAAGKGKPGWSPPAPGTEPTGYRTQHTCCGETKPVYMHCVPHALREGRERDREKGRQGERERQREERETERGERERGREAGREKDGERQRER